MSDNLEWMNKHFVLLRHKTLNDVCNIEGYKIRPDLLSFLTDKTDAEEIVWNFADAERWKCACELMAYMAHRRAAVWWAYQCLMSLIEELKIVPAEERDIDSIATSFEPTVPDFAKVEPPKPDPAMVADMEAKIAEIQADYQKMRALVDPQMMKMVEDGLEVAFKEFEKVHGIHPMTLIDKLVEKLPQEQNAIDPDSPIFKAADDIKAKLMQVRKETLDTIHAVIPPKVPEHDEKMRDDAMQAIYRWIVAPDRINSQKALDIGNQCADTPAGLLALCAFWAGGNLMPLGSQVIPTPAGLAANGLTQVLLMCALHKGGTRKLKERYEHYFDLGVDVLTGKSNWDESVVEGEAPHEASRDEEEEPLKKIEKDKVSVKMSETDEKEAPVVYKRWKPEKKDY